ncbi:MAG: FHA domain-containing protein [Planctomycetota bacterium]
MIRLTIKCRGAEEEAVFYDETVITVGRSSKNNLQLPDNRASRKHFLIEKAPKGYRLIDLGSKNGTLLNGQKAETADLQRGDRIVTGEATIVVSEIALTPAAPAVAAAVPGAPAAGAPAAPAVARPAQSKVMGAGGITIRRGPREMPYGLLDYLLVLIIIGLILYSGAVIFTIAKQKGVVGKLPRIEVNITR